MKKDLKDIRRGDIYYINRIKNEYGSEQHSGRPGIIVSNDANNFFAETVEAVYCTTQPKKSLPTHVSIVTAKRNSTVLCEQITTVSIDKLGNYIGRVTAEEMEQINEALAISLELNDKTKTAPVSIEATEDNGVKVAELTASVKELKKELEIKQIELGAYKNMCENLIDKMISGKSG